MESNWQTYCLMSSIMYIEEMSKPIKHIQIKRYKDTIYQCLCFHSLRLKMKDEETVRKIFNITKAWQTKTGAPLIGKTFKDIKTEKCDGQQYFYFGPLWINLIMAECGTIPNKYSHNAAIMRINNLKHYDKIDIAKNKNLLSLLLEDKYLAAGAFVISMDLECRGIQQGRVSLCMSKKYKDFLEFMLAIAQKWEWTGNKKLSKVSVEFSRKRGINASQQYEFRLSIKGLREIYELAGPLINTHKDKCINFHVQRSKNYVNRGNKMKGNKTKDKILKELIKHHNLTTTTLQFAAGVGIDVILSHLHNLEKEGKVEKERAGKRYVWRAINASKP